MGLNRPRARNGHLALAEEREAVAALAQRLAVLLQAGASPPRAWHFAARASEPHVLDGGSVEPLRPLITTPEMARHAAAPAWRELGVAWRIAERVGAPLADALRSFATAQREAVETLDDIAVALAEPAATARLMFWLPLAGVVLGVALGFDTVSVLFTDPRGQLCLAVGLALLAAARVWTRALVRRAQPPPHVPGARSELLAIALSGGVSIERAETIVDAAAGAAERDEYAPILELSRDAGVPAAELLRADAAEQRRRARTNGRAQAAALGTRLLLPLGVCTLPAFLILGVVPLLLSILGTADLSVFRAIAPP